MCLKPQTIPDVPVEMVRVVRAVFPKGNLYIDLRDTLGTIYRDDLFADVYPDRGQPAYDLGPFSWNPEREGNLA